EEGSYSLELIPYSLPYAAGIAGESRSVDFLVLNQVRAPESVSLPVLSIYPVPSDSELNIQVEEKVSGQVSLLIYNSKGQNIYRQEIAGESLSGYSIDLQSLEIPAGIY